MARAVIVCALELLTQWRCAQGANQIVNLQGANFPDSIRQLSLVSLRAVVVAVDLFRFRTFCAVSHAGIVPAMREMVTL